MIAVAIGLIIPMAMFVTVLTASSHITEAIVVERIRDPDDAIGAHLLSAEVIANLPEALREALYQAAREGAASVAFTAPIRSAWEHLSNAADGATRFLCELEGSMLLLEPELQAPRFDPRGWASSAAASIAGVWADIKSAAGDPGG